MYFLLLSLLLGAFVGVLAGTAVAALLKSGWSGMGWDAGLGGVGMAATLVVFAVLPWPPDTYALPAAWLMAVLLPTGHEVWRRRLGRG